MTKATGFHTWFRRQLGKVYYCVKIETIIHHIDFFLTYSLDVDPNRKKRGRNSVVNCKILESKCVCVCTYAHTYIWMYTQSPSTILYLLLCKISTLLPQQYLCSLKPLLCSEAVSCLFSKTSCKILVGCGDFFDSKNKKLPFHLG